MAGRTGFFGGIRQNDALQSEVDLGYGPGGLIGGRPMVRLGDPNAPRTDGGFSPPSGFDPVWGSLGAPASRPDEHWLGQSEDGTEGLAVEVEIFGAGFQISGQLWTGQFDRLSDWINMQTGFIQVRNAWHVHLGQSQAPDANQRRSTLWVRLNQVVLVAETSPVHQNRPGAPVVQKQRRRVSIVTPGYNLMGSIHVHAYGSMTQFLESPDPHFLPITDLSVRWLSDTTMAGRFPFALINRDQLVTVLDESSEPTGDSVRDRDGEREDEMALHRRSGAA